LRTIYESFGLVHAWPYLNWTQSILLSFCLSIRFYDVTNSWWACHFSLFSFSSFSVCQLSPTFFHSQSKEGEQAHDFWRTTLLRKMCFSFLSSPWAALEVLYSFYALAVLSSCFHLQATYNHKSYSNVSISEFKPSVTCQKVSF
jgi:hypothetical protein